MYQSEGSGEEGEVRDHHHHHHHHRRRRRHRDEEEEEEDDGQEEEDDDGYDGPNIRPPQATRGIGGGRLAPRQQQDRRRRLDEDKPRRGVDDRRFRRGGGDLRERLSRPEQRRGGVSGGHHESDRHQHRQRPRRYPSSNVDEVVEDPRKEQRLKKFISAQTEKDASRRDVQVRRQRKEIERQMEEYEHRVKRKRDRSKSRGERKRSRRREDEDVGVVEDVDKGKERRSPPPQPPSQKQMIVQEVEDDEDDEEEEEEEEEEDRIEEASAASASGSEEEEEEEDDDEDDESDETVSEHSGATPEHIDNDDDETDEDSEDDDEDEEEDDDEDNDDKKSIEEASSSNEGSVSPNKPGAAAATSAAASKQLKHDGLDSKRSTPGSHGSPDDHSVEDLNEEEKLKKELEALPPYLPSVYGCRSAEEFQYLNRIEEGTFGVVYRARDRKTNEVVAMKRLKMEREKEGFPITSLREINTLLIAQHPNVVTVREIVVGSNMDRIFIVMDFVEHDLRSLMETMRSKKQIFLPGEIKCLMLQLLSAISHLHDNWILHRDLKSSNLLLSHNGILKVGDFGLAREYGSPLKPYTAVVVTLWYRAPELLLGIKEYTTHIDVWSIGCLFGEFLLMEPLFPGKSDIDELNKIFKLLGTPHEKIWPGYNKLPAVQKMKFVDYPISHLRSKFPPQMLSEAGLNLLKCFLTYDPSKRITCEEALKADYFKESPLPIDPSMFPTWPAKSELGTAAPKKAASPKPPSGGGAFKKMNAEEDDSKLGFNFVARNSTSVAPGWNLKF